VTGESGTGKELVANAVHGLSARRNKPFRAVNCGALSPSLIESELFGHERGSFTGAVKSHRGFFEQSVGGTLFLDEVTEMPLELQVKLLRALETGTVTRIGGEEPVPVDVRLIAATNRSPDEAVAAGKLREDLHYRLSVFRIHLPPLRDRENDVEFLAEHFLRVLNKAERTSKRFGPGVADRLRGYAWPGNVRELRNVIQRAFIVADAEIGPDLLPGSGGAPNGKGVGVRVGMTLDEAERHLIEATLAEFDGDKRKAAQALGISLKTLYNRLSRS
jgi:DNA-binding NtrC family response regulator